MRLLFSTAALLFGVTAAFGAGEICLAPIPERARADDHDMPRGIPQKREHTYEFTVQLDKNEPIVVPKSSPPRLVNDIALGVQHLLILRDAWGSGRVAVWDPKEPYYDPILHNPF